MKDVKLRQSSVWGELYSSKSLKRQFFCQATHEGPLLVHVIHRGVKEVMEMMLKHNSVNAYVFISFYH